MNEELLDLKKLNTFLKVADTASFTQAAELLHYSPAALTIQIQSLEEKLQVTLFDRMSKKIYLTNAGVQLYEYAKELLCLNEEAIHAFTTEERALRGNLRIGTVASLGSCVFPNLLHAFHTANPQVTISVVTDMPAALYRKLAYNELDLIIVLDEPMVSDELNTILSLPTQVVFCASPEHPLAGLERVTLEQLSEYACILTEEGVSYRHVMDQALAKKGCQLRPAIETDNVNMIFSMLRYSDDFSLLPAIYLTDESQGRKLAVLRTEDLDLSVQMQIFCSRYKYISREIAAFFAVAKDYIYRLFQLISDP